MAGHPAAPADSVPPYFWLSMHVPYVCRDAGACCSSGWPIPLERARVPAIARAIDEHRLQVPPEWLRHLAHQPADVAGVLAGRDGQCVFHQRQPSRTHGLGCAVQDALSHAALPTACQHFPRECLLDDRGVFVTLSHYCPTAASLLVSHEGPLAIVRGPAPIPGGVAEGFDARGAWPPQLRDGVLMDLSSYSRWEDHAVQWLGGSRNPTGACTPESTLAMLERQAAALASWQPGDAPLVEAVHACGDDAPSERDSEPDWSTERRLAELADDVSVTEGEHEGAVRTTPDHRAWPGLAREWRDAAAVINRWLAAHAFASWTAYQGNGVVVQIRKLRLALAVLRREVLIGCTRDGGPLTTDRLIECVRQADLRIVHLADREQMTRRLER
jgi:hypothetical protein